MHLIAKAIRISHAKFHCNRLTAVQDIQDYASLIFWDTVYCHSPDKALYTTYSNSPEGDSVAALAEFVLSMLLFFIFSQLVS